MDQQKRTPYPLRMPDEMRKWLGDKAGENSRSINGEIIQRLKESREKEERQNAAHQ